MSSTAKNHCHIFKSDHFCRIMPFVLTANEALVSQQSLPKICIYELQACSLMIKFSIRTMQIFENVLHLKVLMSGGGRCRPTKAQVLRSINHVVLAFLPKGKMGKLKTR